MNHSVRWIVLVVAILVLAVVQSGHPVAANPDPCGDVQYDPGPPPSKPDPTLSGTVVDGDAQTGVSGATMKVYQCDDGEATYVETVYTSESGQYSSSSLTPEYYYYVEAVLTGPLAGMTAASGTENPSDAVALGDDVTDLDFEFED